MNFHVISEVAGGGEGFGTALALMRLLLQEVNFMLIKCFNACFYASNYSI